MEAYNPDTEVLEYLAGDMPVDGVQSRAFDMNIAGDNAYHPMVRYKDVVLEADVYVAGENDIKVVLICPRCRNSLTIDSSKKEVAFDPPSAKHPRGVLSISPSRCTWELDNDGRRMEFGLGLCNWTFGISRNVARDA